MQELMQKGLKELQMLKVRLSYTQVKAQRTLETGRRRAAQAIRGETPG